MADTIRDAAFEPGRSQPDDSNSTVNLTEDNEASQTPEPSTVPAVVGGKKRGHPVHDCWGHITDTIEPYKKASSPNHVTCQNCKQLVLHHHKVSCVQTHLNKCPGFILKMKKLAVADRPAWFTTEKKTKTKALGKTKAPPKQSSLQKFVIPKLGNAENCRLQRALAMHYYVTATPFQRIEDPHLQRAFDICRPGVKLPCRQKLSDELLDACFSEVQEAVDGFLQTPTTHVCVTSDGWSNILNEPIVNYMAVSPDKAVFVESVPTGEKRHTAEWIANDLTRVVRSLGATVSGAITDNTKANKNAWLILEKEFPDIFFHGCVAHGLHLLVKDILGAKKKVRDRNSELRYPDEYPFEPLLTFAQDCNDLVVFFSSHHLLKARLEAAQDAAQKRRLVSPATTRWGSYQRCLVSIKESDSIITGIVADRDFVTGKRKQHLKREAIKSLVNDKDFITKLDKAIAILQPIDEYITKFQSDSVPLSEVYQAFLQLPAKFKAIPGLKKKEIEYLTTRTKHRFTLIYGPAHGIANLLDPRYISDGMPTDFRRGVEDLLFGFPDADGTCTQDRSIQIIREYTQFRVEAVAQRERGGLRFDILGARGDDGVVQKSILQYWQSDCTGWPVLRRIALKVFTMASSSAASERNFSTFGMVHTKNRNRLLPDKVMKLVYIKTNASLINRPVAKRDSLGPEPASDACI